MAKIIIIVVIVVTTVLLVSTAIIAYRLGYDSARSSIINATLDSVGLSPDTVYRYHDAMRLLNGLVDHTNLDNPYIGTMLTPEAEAKVRQLIAAHRKDIGI